MSKTPVTIDVSMWGAVEGGANAENGFYFELEKELRAVCDKLGLDFVIEEVIE